MRHVCNNFFTDSQGNPSATGRTFDQNHACKFRGRGSCAEGGRTSALIDDNFDHNLSGALTTLATCPVPGDQSCKGCLSDPVDSSGQRLPITFNKLDIDERDPNNPHKHDYTARSSSQIERLNLLLGKLLVGPTAGAPRADAVTTTGVHEWNQARGIDKTGEVDYHTHDIPMLGLVNSIQLEIGFESEDVHFPDLKVRGLLVLCVQCAVNVYMPPMHPIPRITHHAPRTTHHVPRTTYDAPRTTHHTPRTTHHTPRTRYHSCQI